MYNLQYCTLGHFIFILYCEQTVQPSRSRQDSPNFVWKSRMNSYDTRYEDTYQSIINWNWYSGNFKKLCKKYL